MTSKMLSNNELNRATLARQMLLERSDRSIVDATAFLLGLQGQISEGPYLGLWSRLGDFRHQDMTAHILDKTLARATTMRSTLHLHTSVDLLNIRSLVQPVITRMLRGQFGKRLEGLDTKDILKAARKTLDTGLVTIGDVGKVLKEKYPDRDKLALSITVQALETMVQVPPTRIWGSGHAPKLMRVEKWLGEKLRHDLTRPQLVLRYLAGYGPASIADMQSWCGLTKLDADFAAVRDQLVSFSDEGGRELFDLPEAPRPDADTPAPIRFLGVYDNVILGYADRRRMLGSGAPIGGLWADGTNKGSVLIDGKVAASWFVRRGKGSAELVIGTVEPVTRRDRKSVEAEGEALLAFLADGVTNRDVTFAEL